MKETVRALQSRGDSFYLPSATWMLALTLASCSEPRGLRVGEVEIPYRQIQTLEQSLSVAFASDGRATMLWHLLDGGLAEEALLHARLPEASRVAREEADRWAARLRGGESFELVLAEAHRTLPDQPGEAMLLRPGPASLGGSLSAHVAALEEGEWAGPLRTERGWEVVRLVMREAAPRALAQVVLERIRLLVGTPEDWDRARADWVKLPLSGDPELLDALPLEFRHGRVAPEKSR